MKTVNGSVVSSKPISISKAASTLSSFLSVHNGAPKALCAYLRRASDSFNELKQLHKELKSSRSVRKLLHHGSEVSNEYEAAIDSPYPVEDGEKKNSSVSEKKKRPNSRDRTTDGPSLRVQSDNEQIGKAAMENGANGNLEVVSGQDGKKKGGELKIEIEDNPSGKVKVDVESNDRDKSVVAVEKKSKKHKRKSEDRYGDSEDDERESGARLKNGKSQNTDNNGDAEASGEFVENNVAKGNSRKKHEDKKSLGDEKDQVKSEDQRKGAIKEDKSTNNDNDNGTDIVDLSTKKKKKKKTREEDDDFQKNSGEAMVKEEVPVLDIKELKRKEKKKRKNRELGEGGDDGSEEQHSTKRRKG